MITADQLLAHAVGDYILQSDWMATTKTKKSIAALVHVVTYTLPFLLITQSWATLAIICSSHFVIDRWRLARYLVWARNWMGIPEFDQWKQEPNWKTVNWSWTDCSATGFKPDRPPWLATWLLIFADNILHVIINGVAIRWT